MGIRAEYWLTVAIDSTLNSTVEQGLEQSLPSI